MKSLHIDDERVIIVDDFPSFTTSMKKILMLEGINVKIFERPEDFLTHAGIVAFSKCKYLVVDYSMPNLTGYDVYKRLEEICEGNMPFRMILYTANMEQISDKEKKFMKSIGVNFFKKPNVTVLIDDILKTIENTERLEN